MSETLITSTDPKGIRATSLFQAKYNKARLNGDQAQDLNEDREFWSGIEKLLEERTRSNEFADEEVRSTYAYPREYKGPKPIAEQITALAAMLDLDPASALEHAKHLSEFPSGAEGWFAIPSTAAIAKKHFPDVADPAEQYCRAVQLIHKKIAASRQFYNYREGEITPNHLRRHARTIEKLALLAETQQGDILIVAAQLGMRHRGRSVRLARKVFTASEFGLGALEVGSIILVHPERMVCWEELDMDCPGDEFSPGADGQFSSAPIFGFRGGRVRFLTDGVSRPYGRYGSVSAVLPQ